MSLRSFSLLLVAFVVVGCPKEEKKSSPGTEEKKEEGEKKATMKKDKGDDDDGDKPKKKSGDDDAPKKAKGAHELAGASVPAWSKPEKHKGKCVLSKADQKQLDALKTGDDDGAGFDDGKGDVEKLVSGLKKCPSAGAMVSQALNTGGYTRYSKKDYEKANGWFARALVADPANTFARYNLACNLALDGKSEEALWNLEQLLPAAKAGDPRAKHYLTKAKSDEDLASVKKNPRFVTVTTASYEQPMAPCPGKGEVHQAIDQECIHVCASVGGQGGCPSGQACIAATNFGDDLVPFCADTLKCTDGDKGYEVTEQEPYPGPKSKLQCFHGCNDDDGCTGGKKCSGTFAVPTMYGFMPIGACK
jgi:hypothetical protein